MAPIRTRRELDEAVAKLEASKGKDWSDEIKSITIKLGELNSRVEALEKPKTATHTPARE